MVRHGCARLGVLLTDRFLVYGTGGLAYGRVEHAASYATLPGILGIFVGPNPFSFVCNGGIPCFIGASSETCTGWTADAGAEWAVWDNLSVRAEYLYVDLGSLSFPMVATQTFGPPTQVPASLTAATDRIDFHSVRLGLTLRFGPTAVVAKY